MTWTQDCFVSSQQILLYYNKTYSFLQEFLLLFIKLFFINFPRRIVLSVVCTYSQNYCFKLTKISSSLSRKCKQGSNLALFLLPLLYYMGFIIGLRVKGQGWTVFRPTSAHAAGWNWAASLSTLEGTISHQDNVSVHYFILFFLLPLPFHDRITSTLDFDHGLEL